MKKHILYLILTLIIIVLVSFFTWLNVHKLQDEWYKKDSYVICETPYEIGRAHVWTPVT